MKQKFFFLLTALVCLSGMNVWALDQKDGVYQIGSGEDLVAFSALVNGGENTANAVLTADIDMTGQSSNFLPIGTAEAIYSGTFDGQGHRIKNLSISLAQDCVGVFGMIQSPAIIKNFVLDESCTINGGGNYCAIIGQARGNGGPIYMENLGMEGNIHLTGWNGAGIIGNNMGDVAIFHMKNCYVTGSVIAEGAYSGALSGWAAGGGTFENCWVTGDIQGTDNEGSYFIRGVWNANIINCYSKVGTQATNITDEQVASGELCYLLNGNQSEITWYQTIGEDTHPVLDATHGKVYTTAEKRCDGKIIGEGIYTNDASQASVIPAHQYENGVCTVCGQKQEGFMEPDAEGFYNISEASQLVWFATAVNNGEGALNARLTADIDMTEESSKFRPIGSESSIYSGTFDGQGHRIKNLSISLAQDCVGVFGMIQSPAIIKNFVLDESCVINAGGNYCAIIGQARGNGGPIYMENLGMEGKIHLTGWNGAGIIGNNKNDVATFHMKNCYVTGSVIAEGAYSGALSGWAAGGGTFENCWVTGDIQGTDNEGSYFIRGVWNANIINCYSKVGTQATTITDEQVASGELCYLLNGNQSEITWYQTIGEDTHPVLDATHGKVYTTAEKRCDGQIVGEGTYTNDASQASTIPVHQYENDVCTICGQFNPDFLEMKDGFYQIADGAQLVKFSKAVNAGNITFNGQLTADIDMAEENANFLPIGTAEAIYSGTFDGQGHRIKNLSISLAQDCVGVFGLIQSPAIIKNFVLDESCTIDAGGNYCAIIGQARGNRGPIYMENLGMEGKIHLTGWNGAGIIGNNNGDVATFYMKNCYVTGSVIAEGAYSGALSGWAAGGGTFENCWVTGDIQGTDNEGSYFIRGVWNANIINCYSKVGTQATTITDEQVTSGELCYLLNGNSSFNSTWFQTIGEDNHPVFNADHGIIGQITEAGYATMYIPETSVTIPTGVEAFTGIIEDNKLLLNSLDNVITKGQAVVIKGAAGYYSFMPTDAGLGLRQSDLIGTAEELAADGSQYVLAQKDDVIGFYKAEGTIPAGKAYLVSSNGVKGFVFNFDEETSINEELRIKNEELGTAIYNLAGQRLGKMQKGINIVGGKKMMVK